MANAMLCFLRPRFLFTIPVAAALVVASLACVRADESAGPVEEMTVMATADRSLTVREHAGWNVRCEALPHPTLYLDAPPRHGRVCARTEDITISSIYVGTLRQCIGRTVRGVRVEYRPEAGYSGDDTWRYAVQYPTVRRSLSVTVMVERHSALVPSSATAGAPQQAAGLLPPCADLLY